MYGITDLECGNKKALVIVVQWKMLGGMIESCCVNGGHNVTRIPENRNFITKMIKLIKISPR